MIDTNASKQFNLWAGKSPEKGKATAKYSREENMEKMKTKVAGILAASALSVSAAQAADVEALH